MTAGTFVLAALMLGSFLLSSEFAADFDGGSRTGAASNPAAPALVLAIVGSLSAIGAFIRGPDRWSATASLLLFLVGGPIWLTTTALLGHYQ